MGRSHHARLKRRREGQCCKTEGDSTFKIHFLKNLGNPLAIRNDPSPFSERNKANTLLSRWVGPRERGCGPGTCRVCPAKGQRTRVAGHRGAQGTRPAPPLPGLTGLGGGFAISLPGAADPKRRRTKSQANASPAGTPGNPSSFSVWFAAVRLPPRTRAHPWLRDERTQAEGLGAVPAPPRGRPAVRSARPG